MAKLLNTNNIIIVVNSNIANSNSDAIWYCGQRNIPTNNIIQVNFANNYALYFNDLIRNVSPNNVTIQNGTFAGLPVFQGISAMVANGTCQGVILSTYTPAIVTSNVASAWGLPSFFGAANYLWNLYSVSLPSGNINIPACPNPGSTLYPMSGNTAGNYNQYSLTPLSYIQAANNLTMPFGRLGYPNNQVTYISELAPVNTPYTAFGESIFQRAVRLALLSEANNNYLQPHWLSNDIGDATYFTSNTNVAALNTAINKSMNVAVTVSSLNVTNQVTSVYNIVDFRNNNVGYAPPLFAYAVNGSTNSQLSTNLPPSGYAMYSNYSCLPGAWAATWYSFSFELISGVLQNGGSAGIATLNEPLAPYISYPSDIFYQAVSQHCELMVCNWWSRTWTSQFPMGTSAYGDPLYTPYNVVQNQPIGYYFKGNSFLIPT